MRSICLVVISVISITLLGQVRRQVEQIAALQIYSGYTQKGYSIAKRGLGLIGNIKESDLDMHRSYFTSLLTVNPRLPHLLKVAECASLQVKILDEYKRICKQLVQEQAFLRHEERKYLNTVVKRLAIDCAAAIEELILLVSDGKLKMKDNERMNRLDILYGEMQGRYSFIRSCANEARFIVGARIKEKNEALASKSLIQLKNFEK